MISALILLQSHTVNDPSGQYSASLDNDANAYSEWQPANVDAACHLGNSGSSGKQWLVAAP